MNNWNKDLNFSNNMSKSVDKYLKQEIKSIETIDRLKDKNGQVHELDINFAIDGKIILNSGILLTFQEKIRRNHFKKYQDFTIEYYSNVKNKIKGEFFHLAVDYYITGYSNKEETNLVEFRILNVLKLKQYLQNNFNKLIKYNLKQNIKHSNASFLTISYKELEKNDIVIKKLVLN